jgi:hypothetical protein
VVGQTRRGLAQANPLLRSQNRSRQALLGGKEREIRPELAKGLDPGLLHRGGARLVFLAPKGSGWSRKPRVSGLQQRRGHASTGQTALGQ